MASYNIAFKPSVEKDLRPLSKSLVARVMERIEKLKDEPFPRGVAKLSGAERLYRLQVGDYRIVYEIDTEAKQITIHYVRHRRMCDIAAKYTVPFERAGRILHDAKHTPANQATRAEASVTF